MAAALIGLFARPEAQAQESAEADTEAKAGPTAEEMIEVAREAYRPPGLRARRCPTGAPGEIVVCAPVDNDSFRVSSPTDDAYAARVAPPDPVPSAPAMAAPPCDPRLASCSRFGYVPPWPPMVDYSKIPKGLTPEEAAQVFRAEDAPPEP